MDFFNGLYAATSGIAYGSLGFIVGLIYYLVRVYPSYVMAKRARLKNPWLMWIPILGEFKILHLAGFSYWYFILMLIPFVNIIFMIIVFYRIMRNFGFGIGMTILGVIFSFVAFITFWFIVLSDRRFVGDIPREFQEEYND